MVFFLDFFIIIFICIDIAMCEKVHNMDTIDDI